MKAILARFHEPAGLVYHGGAFLYALSGYVFGLWGLFSGSAWVNVLATLWLAHAMTIAAYLIHECGHNTIFRSNRANAVLGELLNWMCGTFYTTYEDIRYKHFRHHMDNDDSVWFMYDEFLHRHLWLARIIQWFEWLYIPAHDLMMHFIIVFNAFIVPGRENQRLRNALTIFVRGGTFFTVLVLAPKAAILYVAAYLLMMHILRFMDSLQHDYGANAILFDENATSRFGGRATEQEHTFSNPLSFRHEWVNWLTLNFGWHNAHHARPTVPWYRLPAWHKANIGTDPDRVIPFLTQLRIYHKYRVHRVLHAGGDLDGRPAPMEADYFKAVRAGEVYGGNAVSFLMSF
jgi:fatty acid desaturase